MASTGEILKKVREGRGLDLKTISAEIKVSTRYLKAIEEGNWNALPAPAYVKGYLRLYANYLGLSPEKIIAQYEKDIKPHDEKKVKLPKKAKKKRKIHYKYPIFIFCFFLLIMWLFWTVFWGVPTNEISKKTINLKQKKSLVSPKASKVKKIPKGVSSVKVRRICICRNIKDREPVAPATIFKLKKTTYLYCFTEVIGAKRPIKIKHIWFYKGKPAMTTILPVKGKRWRTWSKKIVFFDLKGEWEVKVLGPEKQILAKIKFRVE